MKTGFRIAVAAVLLAGSTAAVLVARQASTAAPAKAAASQAPLPPLNTAGYALARPLAVTRAAYEFAARHPEVSRYVPCYCGCEADGHRNNEMCFVGRRDAAGNVVEWDTHGFGCATCVDVARESMQLYNSGADPASIRAAIERKWTPQYTTKTPTPPVPAKKH
jgi:Protein of unknown function with PCYCGC motif